MDFDKLTEGLKAEQDELQSICKEIRKDLGSIHESAYVIGHWKGQAELYKELAEKSELLLEMGQYNEPTEFSRGFQKAHEDIIKLFKRQAFLYHTAVDKVLYRITGREFKTSKYYSMRVKEKY